jgi:hypothetical protein
MLEIYDRHTIHQLEWPETAEGVLAKHHLLPLVLDGTETFIQNAKTHLYILKLDQVVIPFTVNEEEYDNCYLLSSYYVAASLKEKSDAAKPWRSWVDKLWIPSFSKLLKLIKINKVIIINNWLLTTNPYPELTSSQIHTIVTGLKKLFPQHYMMFRSINNYQSETMYHALVQEQFRMIPCRHVYLYDPKLSSSLPNSVLRKQKKDINRISNRDYQVETLKSISSEDIRRLLELYRYVYVNKYTQYSPLYTDKFLLTALNSQTIRLKVLKKEGIIYGVVGFLEKNGYLLVPFFGYDTTVPQEEGLYRMLSGVIMQEIEARKLISHQGSGAGQFKKWRGFFEQLEYVGIYDQHLPLYRRLFWGVSEKFSEFFLNRSAVQEETEE